MALIEKVSYERFLGAVRDVWRELGNLGLMGDKSRLHETEVIWCQYPQPINFEAAGYFLRDDWVWSRPLGWKKGNMYIPKTLVFKSVKYSVRDVIRHEYAHAIEYHYPEFLDESSDFEKAFGAPPQYKIDVTKDSEYISEYAKENTSEDFAEMFMVYVRRQGIIPTTMNNAAQKRKWKFVERVVKKTSRCTY